jgi:hypothetical protein
VEQEGDPPATVDKTKTGIIMIQSIPIECSIDIPLAGVAALAKIKDKCTIKDVKIGTYPAHFSALGKGIDYDISVKENETTRLMVDFSENSVQINTKNILKLSISNDLVNPRYGTLSKKMDVRVLLDGNEIMETQTIEPRRSAYVETPDVEQGQHAMLVEYNGSSAEFSFDIKCDMELTINARSAVREPTGMKVIFSEREYADYLEVTARGVGTRYSARIMGPSDFRCLQSKKGYGPWYTPGTPFKIFEE